MIVLACIASVGWAYPVRVSDARGKEVSVKARPMRIVSLAPNITEILYAIGAGDRVVAVTNSCNYPPEAAKKPKVGDMRTTAEAVLAMNPDLVIAHAFMSATLIVQIENLHKTVFAMDPKTISQTEADIQTIGQIVGRSDAAKSVVAKMRGGSRPRRLLGPARNPRA